MTMDATVPQGSCAGTGSHPTPGSISQEGATRKTGLCPLCHGRFRLGSDSRLPNHQAAPATRT
jgi:hypothetical protein